MLMPQHCGRCFLLIPVSAGLRHAVIKSRLPERRGKHTRAHLLARYFPSVSIFKGLVLDGDQGTSAKDKRKHPEGTEIFHCSISCRPYDRCRSVTPCA